MFFRGQQFDLWGGGGFEDLANLCNNFAPLINKATENNKAYPAWCFSCFNLLLEIFFPKSCITSQGSNGLLYILPLDSKFYLFVYIVWNNNRSRACYSQHVNTINKTNVLTGDPLDVQPHFTPSMGNLYMIPVQQQWNKNKSKLLLIQK